MTAAGKREPLVFQVARFFALCGGVAMLASAALISLDVIVRGFFGIVPFRSFELSSYAFAVATAFSFGLALFERKHIRIDALYRRFPARMRLAFDIVNLALMLAMAGTLAYHGAIVAHSSWQIGATSQSGLSMPLAIPQGLWALGLVWFVACGLYLAIIVLCRLAARQFEEVEQAIGVDLSNTEEV